MFFKNDDISVVFFYTIALFIFLLIIFFSFYLYLYRLRTIKFKLHLNQQELRKRYEIYFAFTEGEEKERKRLAEELHDGIGTKLCGFKMSLEYIHSTIYLNPENKTLVEKVLYGINETIHELREISRNLQPSFLTSKGLVSALDEMVAHFNIKGECYYQLRIEGHAEITTPTLQTSIYRIVSELLTNVQKHAKASLSVIQILRFDNKVKIIVEDNGIGFNRNAPYTGIGILNISSRVNLCGGKFLIDSILDKGTTVIVELPIL